MLKLWMSNSLIMSCNPEGRFSFFSLLLTKATAAEVAETIVEID